MFAARPSPPLALFDVAPDLVCAAGPGGRLTYTNEAWQRALGYAPAEAAELGFADLIAVEDQPRFDDVVQAVEQGVAAPFTAALVARDGRRVPCRVHLAAGDDGHLWLRCQDETAARAAARAEAVIRRGHATAALRAGDARLQDVLGALSVIAVQLDAAGAVAFANDAFLDATGWARAEVVGGEWCDGLVPAGCATRALFDAALAPAGGRRADAAPAHGEGEVFTRDGDRRLVAWDVVPMRDVTGRPAGAVAVGRDVTDARRGAGERARLTRALAAMSDRDELTGLLNRRGFGRVAEHAARVAARTRRADAVLCVDVEELAAVGAAYGDAAADDAVCAVAEALRAVVRESDVVARVGPGAFLVYAIGTAAPDHADATAGRVRAALDAQNVRAQGAGRAFDLTCAVRVAARQPGDDLEAMLARAAAASAREPLARGWTGAAD